MQNSRNPLAQCHYISTSYSSLNPSMFRFFDIEWKDITKQVFRIFMFSISMFLDVHTTYISISIYYYETNIFVHVSNQYSIQKRCLASQVLVHTSLQSKNPLNAMEKNTHINQGWQNKIFEALKQSHSLLQQASYPFAKMIPKWKNQFGKRKACYNTL